MILVASSVIRQDGNSVHLKINLCHYLIFAEKVKGAISQQAMKVKRIKPGDNFIGQDLTKILTALKFQKNRIQTVAFNNLKGEIVRRIFNRATATDGTPIGNYQPSTKKFRNEIGRRIDTVDLEITGTLRRSIVVGTDGQDVVFGFKEQTEPDIRAQGKRKLKKGKGGGVNKKKLVIKGKGNFPVLENAISQEERFGKEIFAPSEDELKKGDKAVMTEIDLIVKELFN